MMVENESPAEKIVRERSLRQSGENSSTITIPPIVREFTEFSVGSDVEISAEVGGDEIRLRLLDKDADEQSGK